MPRISAIPPSCIPFSRGIFRVENHFRASLKAIPPKAKGVTYEKRKLKVLTLMNRSVWVCEGLLRERR